MKQLGTALILIFFACWFGQSTAQLCDCRNVTCRSQAMMDNPNSQICCNLSPQPVDTNPNSLNDPNGTPLGFQLLEYRGTDSNQPDLCTRVSFSTNLGNGRLAYVVAAVQSETEICVRRRNPGPDDEATCGSGGVFFCESFTSGSNVELEFLCNGNVNQAGSCPVNDDDFYVKTSVTVLDTDDEDFCDNVDRTLPNSLVQNFVTPSANPNPGMNFDGGALPVVSLLQPALLLLSLLLATLLLLH